MLIVLFLMYSQALFGSDKHDLSPSKTGHAYYNRKINDRNLDSDFSTNDMDLNRNTQANKTKQEGYEIGHPRIRDIETAVMTTNSKNETKEEIPTQQHDHKDYRAPADDAAKTYNDEGHSVKEEKKLVKDSTMLIKTGRELIRKNTELIKNIENGLKTIENNSRSNHEEGGDPNIKSETKDLPDNGNVSNAKKEINAMGELDNKKGSNNIINPNTDVSKLPDINAPSSNSISTNNITSPIKKLSDLFFKSSISTKNDILTKEDSVVLIENNNKIESIMGQLRKISDSNTIILKKFLEGKSATEEHYDQPEAPKDVFKYHVIEVTGNKK